MATSSEREERRKRITDKGLNRMSHIQAGRAPKSNNSSSTAAQDRHQPAQSDLLHEINEKGLHRTTHVGERSQSNPPILESNAFSDQLSAGLGGGYGISRGNSLDIRSQLQKEAIDAGERRPLQKASRKGESLQKPCQDLANLFSPKRLNSCIIASERTRSFCALLIALLVLLSYIGYPLLGINLVRSEGIIVSRPVYIILLTDVTVVLGRLYLNQNGDSEEAEEEMAGSHFNKKNWVGAVKLLERGLVAYQTIRALFIDFSIYAVVVICGLSLI